MFKKTIFILSVLFSSSSQASDALHFLGYNASGTCPVDGGGDGENVNGQIVAGAAALGIPTIAFMLHYCFPRQVAHLASRVSCDGSAKDTSGHTLKKLQKATLVKVGGRRVGLRFKSNKKKK